MYVLYFYHACVLYIDAKIKLLLLTVVKINIEGQK